MESHAGCVIVADDHPMCREAARLAVGAVSSAPIVEAASLHEVLSAARPAALILLDLGLPDSRGIASLVDVVREHPRTPVLVVSGAEGGDIEARVASAGGVGFVSKAAPLTELVAAVQTIFDGGRHFSTSMDAAAPADDLADRLGTLTPSEARVLRAMSDGALNKQIAFDLGLSEVTVKQHITAILRKLQVANRTQAVLARHRVEHI